ncbi:MAG: hypothetical protein LBR90_01140 [Elusimicrobiota bacterium]|jgi:LPS-assembly protein|nr:hypothetical protein [Elusimicrobiota bacterium]
MKFKILLPAAFLFLCASSAAGEFALPSPTKNEFIYFTADEVTFDQASGVAALVGNASVLVDDNTPNKRIIKSRRIQIFTKERVLISDGETAIEDETGSITMQNAHFDINSRALIMRGVAADYAPIRVLSTQSIETQKDRYILRKANVTCCDKDAPHYSVYVGKADLIPNDRIWAFNAVVKLGRVPVFYLPVLYRSLNQDRLLTTYLDFMQSGHTGFGVLTSTVYSGGAFRLTGNLDYYTNSGLGYGASVAYDDPQKFRGALQAYAIHDNNQPGLQDRWGVNGGYWWQAADTSDSLNNKDGAIYFSQLEIRTLSDADFNDSFFRANPYVVSPDKVVRASAVRQSRLSTMRLSYSNRRELNPADKTYFNAQETLPRADLIFNPFTIKPLFGLVNQVSFSLNNTKIEDFDFVQYMQGRWQASRDIALHRNFTLTPQGFFDQQIILKDPTNNNEDKFVSRYGGSLNLRSDFVTGLLDVGYRYERRSTSGALTTAPGNALDGGEEANLFYVQNYYLPTPNLYVRVGTGYNLQNSQESWGFKKRLEPVLAEAGFFIPQTGTNIYLQNLYDLEGGNQAFVFNGTLGSLSGTNANLGVTNYSSNREEFLVTAKFTLAPKNFTWRADMGMDFSVNDGVAHAYSKHVKVYKDFHDFGLMLGLMDRNQNLSVSFRIFVMCGRPVKQEASKQIDRYWYPWRDEQMVRDNF